MTRNAIIVGVSAMIVAYAASAQTIQVRTLDEAGAERVLQVAKENARKRNAPSAIAVVDPAGDLLEVDHNTTLAQSVPAHAGDALVIHGQLYIDPGPRVGVHCTHAQTSSGCPNSGWIEFQNNYYE